LHDTCGDELLAIEQIYARCILKFAAPTTLGLDLLKKYFGTSVVGLRQERIGFKSIQRVFAYPNQYILKAKYFNLGHLPQSRKYNTVFSTIAKKLE